mmetsp:Transcript_70583/g.112152  ORF Transcript_70583/g.112152 Transcript_70583/m.112152 type:complete len:261 (-) Transcript_70583:526-1308(-)
MIIQCTHANIIMFIQRILIDNLFTQPTKMSATKTSHMIASFCFIDHTLTIRTRPQILLLIHLLKLMLTASAILIIIEMQSIRLHIHNLFLLLLHRIQNRYIIIHLIDALHHIRLKLLTILTQMPRHSALHTPDHSAIHTVQSRRLFLVVVHIELTLFVAAIGQTMPHILVVHLILNRRYNRRCFFWLFMINDSFQRRRCFIIRYLWYCWLLFMITTIVITFIDYRLYMFCLFLLRIYFVFTGIVRRRRQIDHRLKWRDFQ